MSTKHKPTCAVLCAYWPKPFDACLEHLNGHACDCGALPDIAGGIGAESATPERGGQCCQTGCSNRVEPGYLFCAPHLWHFRFATGDPPPASPDASTCTCASIQAADGTRHFRECPLRAKYPEGPVTTSQSVGSTSYICKTCGADYGTRIDSAWSPEYCSQKCDPDPYGESVSVAGWATVHATNEPPFDGSAPCPFCPLEVRNLMAVAHNLSIGSRDTTIDDLRKSVEACRPLADRHFADSMHSHGHVRSSRK